MFKLPPYNSCEVICFLDEYNLESVLSTNGVDIAISDLHLMEHVHTSMMEYRREESLDPIPTE